MTGEPQSVLTNPASEQQVSDIVQHDIRLFWDDVNSLARQQLNDPSISLSASLLYQACRDKLIDRAEFQLRLCRGSAISTLMARTSLELLKDLFHPESSDWVRSTLPQGKPVVFLDDHFTSTVALRFFSRYLFVDAQHLDARGIERQGGTRSLVRLVRSLQSGRHVIISPDGALGDAVAQINVMGFSIKIGKGAAVLAHAANCPVVAMHAVVQGSKFVPKITVGPSPQYGEKLDVFFGRVASFYERHLDTILKSDPINIGFPVRILSAFRRSVRSLDKEALGYSIEACHADLSHTGESFLTHQLLTDLYRTAGDLDNAIRHSRLACAVATREQDKISQTVNLASLLRVGKRPMEGLELVNASIADNPDSFRLQFAKSQILAGLNNPLEAIEVAKNALKMEGTSDLIYRHLANLYMRIGDSVTAAEHQARFESSQNNNNKDGSGIR